MDSLHADPQATDDGHDHHPRQVFSGHYVPVTPTAIPAPEYIAHSKTLFKELGLSNELVFDEEFRRLFSGDITSTTAVNCKKEMQGIAVMPQGLEIEGKHELLELGAKEAIPRKRCVAFKADIGCFYRLYLKARLPFRLLREIASFPCNSPHTLYKQVQLAHDWEHWLHPSMSFRVDVSGSTQGLTHSHFTALQVKNALVDLQKNLWGQRSDINLSEPDLCIHLHLNQKGAVLSLDGAHESLHKRGYRTAMGNAPLKENLAAGLMRISNWDGSIPLIDPLCGSGSLLIEGVGMALGLACRLNRQFLLENWADFDYFLWEKEKEKARRQEQLIKPMPVIIGCETDAKTSNEATFNIANAGLEHLITIKNGHFNELVLPSNPGIIVCNPPYGKRIGNEQNLSILYEELGRFLKRNASGWNLWLLSGNPFLSGFLKMKCSKKIPLSNGGIDCRWLKYEIL